MYNHDKRIDNIRYKNIPQELDRKLLRHDVMNELQQIAHVIGCTENEAYIYVSSDESVSWSALMTTIGEYKGEKVAKSPILSTYLNICNTFGLDARKYIVLIE